MHPNLNQKAVEIHLHQVKSARSFFTLAQLTLVELREGLCGLEVEGTRTAHLHKKILLTHAQGKNMNK